MLDEEGFRLSVWLGQLMKEKNRSIARAVLVIEYKVIYRPFFILFGLGLFVGLLIELNVSRVVFLFCTF